MEKKITWAVVALLVLIGGIGTYQYLQAPRPEATAPQHLSVTMTIDGIGNKSAEVMSGTTALELLRSESQKDGFILAEKEYAGLGILVEQIGVKHNGTDNLYWHYYVNGALSGVGADSYALQNGDHIEWKFETSQE